MGERQVSYLSLTMNHEPDVDQFKTSTIQTFFVVENIVGVNTQFIYSNRDVI
jgi:hypothetical protein